MKKTPYFLAALFVSVFAIVSCTGQNNRLKTLVDEINAACPLSAGEIGDMLSAEIAEGNVIITMEINEGYMNIDALDANPELLRQSLIEGFRNPTDDMKSLLDELKLCNAGLKYVYKGKTTGKTTSIMLTNKEIKNLANVSESDQDPDALLDAQIKITNAQLPIRIDESTIMTRLEREKDCVVYYYDVDETSVSLEELEEYRESVENYLTQQLQRQKDEASSKLFINACIMNDVDIVYHYCGTTTGKTIDFRVDIDDI